MEVNLEAFEFATNLSPIMLNRLLVLTTFAILVVCVAVGYTAFFLAERFVFMLSEDRWKLETSCCGGSNTKYCFVRMTNRVLLKFKLTLTTESGKFTYIVTSRRELIAIM